MNAARYSKPLIIDYKDISVHIKSNDIFEDFVTQSYVYITKYKGIEKSKGLRKEKIRLCASLMKDEE